MKKHVLVTTIAIVLILAASAYFAISLKRTPAINFISVKKGSLTQGVTASGQVVAAQDLSLAFEQGGTVTSVNVQAGDTVKQGQTLVKLDTRDLSAVVNQTSAALDIAKANYQKLLNGATSANLSVAQTALDNAQKNLAAVKSQQSLIVKNAAAVLLNSNIAATPSANNISATNPTISGNYTDTTQGQYQIKIYSSGSGYHFILSGLENGDGLVSTAPVALGSKGLFIQFNSINAYPNDSWTINIPNTQSSSYLTNLNAYNNALQSQNQALTTAQAAVDSAQQNLQLLQTPARAEDVAAANAQVEAAAAQLQTAQNNLSKSTITAPIDGTITAVNTKVGQTVSGSTIAPGPAVIKMISAEKFQITSFISEADIGKIKVGDQAKVTLDAYGSQSYFDATVINIDPSSTIQKGVTTYKTTLEFKNNDDRIKEGMNANISVSDQTHTGILIIPSSAIIKKDNKQYVLTNNGTGKAIQTEIQTGISDLNGNTEVTSGLSEGQQVASFGNQ